MYYNFTNVGWYLLIDAQGDGEPVADRFTDVPEISGYIPQVQVAGYEFPFLLCDIDEIATDLLGPSLLFMISIEAKSTVDVLVEQDRRNWKKKSLAIKRDKEGAIVIAGLTHEPVKGLKDVVKLLKSGNVNRATAATDLNEHVCAESTLDLPDVMLCLRIRSKLWVIIDWLIRFLTSFEIIWHSIIPIDSSTNLPSH